MINHPGMGELPNFLAVLLQITPVAAEASGISTPNLSRDFASYIKLFVRFSRIKTHKKIQNTQQRTDVLRTRSTVKQNISTPILHESEKVITSV